MPLRRRQRKQQRRAAAPANVDDRRRTTDRAGDDRVSSVSSSKNDEKGSDWVRSAAERGCSGGVMTEPLTDSGQRQRSQLAVLLHQSTV